MTARKRQPPPRPWWEVHAAKLILSGAAAGALVTLWNFSTPFTSSHLPSASQIDVQRVQDDLEKHVDTLGKAVDQTLEVAKAANQAAQASVQYTNDSRLDRLLQQKIQIQDQLVKLPNDAALKGALARTEIDIAKLTAAIK